MALVAILIFALKTIATGFCLIIGIEYGKDAVVAMRNYITLHKKQYTIPPSQAKTAMILG